ncbi:MAG: hypothetical protein JXX28_01350 [Deltaproteobacteria bacterium]|nr:hypothetical protein [Deltaproteobacteria bacterium]
MTLALLSSLALAVAPAQLSAVRKDPTPVWLLPGAQTYEVDARRCTAELNPHPELPAGLPAAAHLITDDCGNHLAFLDFPFQIHGERRSKWARVPLDAISLTPPRVDLWSGAPPQGTGWVRWTADRPVRGLLLDQPQEQRFALLAHGEQVAVLDRAQEIVRTADGHAVLLDAGLHLVDEDPYLARALPEVRALRDRLSAGRAAHPWWRLIDPSADIAPRDEAVYALEIDAADLDAERFQPGWLDPVGQRLRHRCDRTPAEGEPCGDYWLDYTAFGAWWPRYDTWVLAELDGTEVVEGVRLPRLRVLVRQPWGEKLEVSPSWAQQPPP